MNEIRMTGAPAYDTVCLIVARNLGDAVIQSIFFRELVARGFAQRYVVWARPQVGFIFEGVGDCQVITSQFPVGTNKQFDWRGAAGFWRAARALRGMRLDATIDLIGDFRERLMARVAGSPRHLHIGWAPGHPFTKIIRNPFGRGRPAYEVPVAQANVYGAYASLLDALTAAASARVAPPQGFETKPLRRVGLHPFASQDCKLWPTGHWRALAMQFLAEGIEVTAYGAPSERTQLEEIFGGLSPRVRIFTESIKAFAADVATLDLMIGLDSFSVHIAERQGVRSIMLNACNHPTLWQPPHGAAVTNSGGCAAYPCMNVPVCESSATPYVCIKSVSVFDVGRVAHSTPKLAGVETR